jgi:cyclic pyranopterin phosphate synthase
MGIGQIKAPPLPGRRMSARATAVDQLGRALHDLRISVTDRCNLRCSYCMPADCYRKDHTFLSKSALLDFEEMARVTRAAVDLGVRKIRLTGGEPLLRHDLPVLVAQLAAIPGIEDLAMTTNGLLLKQQAGALRQAGLQRLTVSLDSLEDSVLEVMNGAGARVAPVLRGIEAAMEAGFGPPKINVVVQRGVNDAGVLDIVRYFRGTGCIPRFIEFMDVGTINRWTRSQVVPSRELRDIIHRVYPMEPRDAAYRGEVAERYAFLDAQGEVGFISSVTQPFCGACSRWRLSSDGMLFSCLFAGSGKDVKGLLRTGANDAALTQWMQDVWQARNDRYSEKRVAPNPSMQGPKVEMYHVGG